MKTLIHWLKGLLGIRVLEFRNKEIEARVTSIERELRRVEILDSRIDGLGKRIRGARRYDQIERARSRARHPARHH